MGALTIEGHSPQGSSEIGNRTSGIWDACHRRGHAKWVPHCSWHAAAVASVVCACLQLLARVVSCNGGSCKQLCILSSVIH
eukprot:1158148-Pelagomonas_calceolata.AAC.6